MANSNPARGRPGKPPKYRASCDSCNEAKVRCSQARPSCARCTKNGVPCVYGISQRSGKHSAGSFSARNNPPAPQLPTPTASGTESPRSTDTVNLRDVTLPTPVTPGQNPDFPGFFKQQLKNGPFSSIILPNGDLNPQELPMSFEFQSISGRDETQGPGQRHQLRPLSRPSPEDFSQSIGNESMHSYRTGATPNFLSDDLSGLVDASVSHSEQDGKFEHFPYQMPNVHCSSCATNRPNLPLPSPEDCQCNEIIITQLSSLPVLLGAERCNVDVELVQFQEAIRLCTSALACTCAGKDYTSVLTIAMLVARILSVFERSSHNITNGETNHTGDSSRSASAMSSPKFSLGMYQMDQEDERKLKQEVWWLQAQKVESLVAGFGELIRKTKQQELYPDVAQVSAWEKLHFFLDRKAQAAKNKWAASRVKS
ncbi:MAG: hypothetical protein Q9191_005344 [Dirinaria sp. TL-2023a]